MNFLSKRNFSHLSVRYNFNSISVIYDEFRNKDIPLISSSSFRILDRLLTATDIGVELRSQRIIFIVVCFNVFLTT